MSDQAIKDIDDVFAEVEQRLRMTERPFLERSQANLMR
jgi:hypothetical protein